MSAAAEAEAARLDAKAEQAGLIIGEKVARMVFKQRGGCSEVHLNEGELAGCIAAGVAIALREARKAIDDSGLRGRS